MRNYIVGDKVAITKETLANYVTYPKELSNYILRVEKVYTFGSIVRLSVKCARIKNKKSKYGYFYFTADEVYPAEECIDIIDNACINLKKFLSKQEGLDEKYIDMVVRIEDKNYRMIINDGE